MKFFFTRQDRLCFDEYQPKGSMLSDEGGWWFPNGDIYIWALDVPMLRQIGTAVHEAMEYIMICKLSLPRNLSHWFSNCCELLASLGTADIWHKDCWEPQVWKK